MKLLKLSVAILLISGLLFAIFLVNNISQNKEEPKSNSGATTNLVNTPQPEKLRVSKEDITYFDEIALGQEFGVDSPSRVRKWVDPTISINVVGSRTQNDDICLNSVISDFNALSSESKMQIDQGSDDITVNFAPENTFESLEPNYQPINYGYFWVNYNNDGSIKHANVLISTTNITQAERCHLIREELTQSTGLMKDSHSYASSMFYDDWTTTSTYSVIDEQLIRILYGGNGVRPNDSGEQVRGKVIVN